MKKPTLKEVILSSIIGLFLLPITFYIFSERRNFILGAEIHQATIVRVEYEKIRRRKRSFYAYIPVVEVSGENDLMVQMRVDTYDESPVSHVGEKLEVLCNRSMSDECILNTFYDKWFNQSVGLIISMLCFLPLMVYLSKRQDRKVNQRRLKQNQRQLRKQKK